MATPVLMIDKLQKDALDAGFAAAFDGEPTRYFSAPGRTEIGGNHTDHQRGRVHDGCFCAWVEILQFFRYTYIIDNIVFSFGGRRSYKRYRCRGKFRNPAA